MAEKTRAFIAIELPDQIRHAILNVQNRLKRELKGIKWIAPGNIHLTLRFLGDLDKSEIDTVIKALDNAAFKGTPFSFSAKGVGAFPGFSRPRVLWVGLAGEVSRLSEFYVVLEDQLERFGLEKEERKFKGHLTIGRVKGRLDSRRFIESIKPFMDFETEPFSVSQIILFKSELRPEGPVYTRLHKARLSN